MGFKFYNIVLIFMKIRFINLKFKLKFLFNFLVRTVM